MFIDKRDGFKAYVLREIKYVLNFASNDKRKKKSESSAHMPKHKVSKWQP